MKKHLLASSAAIAVLLLCGVARATTIELSAILSGAAEAPPNDSPGSGFTTVVYDNVAHTLQVDIIFAGLLGTTTASHIHGPTALPFDGNAGVITAVPTFTGFPLGVTAGTYSHVFDLTLASSFNPAFITANGGTPAAAETVLANALVSGRAYLNIHSTYRPGGEIRGFLTPVPDGSATGVLFVTAVLGLLGLSRYLRAHVA